MDGIMYPVSNPAYIMHRNASKGLPRYNLTHWVVNRDKEGHAHVHLHGETKPLFGALQKRVEIIEVGTVPLESEGELVVTIVGASLILEHSDA